MASPDAPVPVGSEPLPVTTGWMTDDHPRRVTFRVLGGSVGILASPPILLRTPEKRDEFMRHLMECYRSADGEPPATEAQEDARGVALATVELTCITPQAASIVAAEADRPSDEFHSARAEGNRVIITYYDKRYPLDVAEWALALDCARDEDAATVIASL